MNGCCCAFLQNKTKLTVELSFCRGAIIKGLDSGEIPQIAKFPLKNKIHVVQTTATNLQLKQLQRQSPTLTWY